MKHKLLQVSQSNFEGSQLLIWLCLKVGVEEWHGLREKESQRSEKHTILGKQHLWSGISLNIRNSQICLFRPIPCHSTLDPLAGARTESSLGPSEGLDVTSSLFCFLDGCSPPSEGISRRQSLVWSLCHSRQRCGDSWSTSCFGLPCWIIYIDWGLDVRMHSSIPCCRSFHLVPVASRRCIF